MTIDFFLGVVLGLTVGISGTLIVVLLARRSLL